MEIKILQWNVWYKENPDKIIAALQEIDADILCLQELTRTSEFNPGINVFEKIVDELSLYPAYSVAQEWHENGVIVRDQGNGIFSKYYITEHTTKHVQKSSSADPDFDDENRIYTEAVIDINGYDLTAATAHMSYTNRFEGSVKRDAENAELLKHIGHDRKNYIFTGDLNAPRDSEIVDMLPRKTNLRITSPPYAENTWTTKPFSYNGFTVEELAWRLDYAFCSSDIEVIKTEILQTDVSDHLPILLTIKIG